MKTIYLSYYINNDTPLYGGENAINITKRTEISRGASSNTTYLKLPNHTGTHIDFPNHFSDKGKTINDYRASFWKFDKVWAIDYNAEAGEIIDVNAISYSDVPVETEFLIIKTGFGKYRNEEKYWKNNPGLSPELAKILKDRCPNLKVVGFDFISVSSYQNRMLGREAHKEFLINHNILLIEDMKLDEMDKRKIKTITALPLLIDKIDGGPITIIAEME